jgi:stress response protein YsnF
MAKKVEPEITVPLVQERASVRKRTVDTGRVRIRTLVDEQTEWVREELLRENVEVERVPIGREVDTLPHMRQENGVLIVPVVEETLVVERRLVLREELHVRVTHRAERVEQPVKLRSMRAIVERDGNADSSK